MRGISLTLIVGRILAFLVFALASIPALSQSPPPPFAPQSVGRQPRVGMSGIVPANGEAGFLTVSPGGFFAMRQITGKPYSLELESRQTQTLADGTNINRSTGVNREYRDSVGRTRTEHEPMFPGHPSELRIIQIEDPVAQVRYVFNTQERIARRYPLKVVPSRPGEDKPLTAPISRLLGPKPPTGASDRPRPEGTQEPLGTQTFEGVLAEGVRTTMVFPVDWEGNDRPIESVCERWTATDLKVIVMSKCSDPRRGETTTQLTRAELSDPDPSLFQVPEGYKIIKEKSRDRGLVGGQIAVP